MRLIDADELESIDFSECVDSMEIMAVIDMQPTVYDIDNVVKELELHSFELGKDSIPSHYVRFNDAIEIVRGGVIKSKIQEKYNRYFQEYKHLFEPYIEPQGKVYELDDFANCLIKQKENLIDLVIHWIFNNTDRTDETGKIVKFLEVLKDDYFCGNTDCIINKNKKCYYNTSCKYRIKSNCKVGG